MVAGYQAWAGKVQASNLAAHSPVQDMGLSPDKIKCSITDAMLLLVAWRRLVRNPFFAGVGCLIMTPDFFKSCVDFPPQNPLRALRT